MDANIYMEESFDITKNERLFLVTGDRGTSRIKKFENQTGTYIRIGYDSSNNAILKIYGYPSQLEAAKILIRDTLEETSFIPMISYLILTEPVSNRKIKFVKCERNDNSNGKTGYCVEFSHTIEKQKEGTDVTNEIIKDVRITTPPQFNTFDKIEDCLDNLSSKLNLNLKQISENSLFSEKIILKPRIFFGKVLFTEINHPEEFTLQEWYRLNRRSRRGSDYNGYDYDDKGVNVEFQQNSPQIYEKFNILKQEFGFEFDNKQVIEGVDKGAIYIYYNPSPNKKRKMKLRWDKGENRWKVTNHSHSMNRIANMDIISGTKAPDFRFSLKTYYDLLPEISKVEEEIDRIQLTQNFAVRDGMYFRSSDFEGTSIKKAVVRQVIEKKRFRNGKFLLTFSTIKHDGGDNKIAIQKLITFRHISWTQEIGLDNERFINTVNDTLYYVKDMMDSMV